MTKLYLISQDTNNCFDSFDSAVVCAENEEQAKNIYPYYSNLCSPQDVKVQYIGEAADNINVGEVICASYTAG